MIVINIATSLWLCMQFLPPLAYCCLKLRHCGCCFITPVRAQMHVSLHCLYNPYKNLNHLKNVSTPKTFMCLYIV